MLKFKRIDLFSRLSQPCYQCLESATLLCKTRGNPYVELVHLLNQLQMSTGTAYAQVVKHFHLDEDKLTKDYLRALEALPRGSNAILDFSSNIELMIKEAFMACELIYKCPQINSAHLLLALKQNDSLNKLLVGISSEFNKINGDVLQEQLNAITQDAEETQAQVATLSASQTVNHVTTSELGQNVLGGSNVLEQYTVDLTAKAASGKIDEIWGRDVELYKVIDVLLRRRQNNPILTGEAGVGKTAVAEAFALRLARNQVPDALKGTKLLSLDLALLQAGASMKGEFEQRLKNVIDAVKDSATPIILFIDEAHTLIGAGGQAGQNDAANLLKPALARGELRCIAATTLKEYARYFEKDPALSRRFENIIIEEPSLTNACAMLHAIKGALEHHHHVTILDEAVDAAVRQSSRYIPARQLPDKAVSVLDTACAKVALSQSSTPASIEFLQQQIKGLERAQDILKQEQTAGFDHAQQLSELAKDLQHHQNELSALKDKYAQCQALFQEYQSLNAQLLSLSPGLSSAQSTATSTTSSASQGTELHTDLSPKPQSKADANLAQTQNAAPTQCSAYAQSLAQTHDSEKAPNLATGQTLAQTSAPNSSHAAAQITAKESVFSASTDEVTPQTPDFDSAGAGTKGDAVENSVEKSVENAFTGEKVGTSLDENATEQACEHTGMGTKEGAVEGKSQETTQAQLLDRLSHIREKLAALQEDGALILPEVNAQAVNTVISEWTGIPLGRMVKNELKSLLGLEDALKARVIGQDHALTIIAQRILTSRAALADPSRPIAVLMLAGPSGVGKTETAHALAEEIYGTDDNLITINMSEFQEAHTVSTLKGAPPGYVGYGEGGVLTEAVRRRPYSVVLLDEIEKAHKDVHEMFFQIFDKGEMEDGEGRHVNFKNCVIILTTNVGDEVILQACQDPEHLPDPELLSKSLHQSLAQVFPEALLGRLQVIAYYPLMAQALAKIVKLKLNKIVKRVQEQYGATLECDPSLYDEIIRRCDNVGAGARMLDGIINNSLLPELSLKFLECLLEGKQIKAITLGAHEQKFSFNFEFAK